MHNVAETSAATFVSWETKHAESLPLNITRFVIVEHDYGWGAVQCGLSNQKFKYGGPVVLPQLRTNLGWFLPRRAWPPPGREADSTPECSEYGRDHVYSSLGSARHVSRKRIYAGRRVRWFCGNSALLRASQKEEANVRTAAKCTRRRLIQYLL